MPRVTVGMPVYNGERFLAESLESWLAQDFADFELVVSDNASSDATPRMLAEYAKGDSRIRIVSRRHTVMAHENFNGLVDEASAPYFCWAACDDLRDPCFLSRLVSVLEREPEVVLAYCHPRYLGSRERSRGHRIETGVRAPGQEETGLGRAIAHLRVRGWLPVYGLFRTEALRRSHRFHYPMGLAADVGLVLEIATFGKLRCVPETLMSFRLRPDSISMDPDDPIHFGKQGRSFDANLVAFLDDLPLRPVERDILAQELRAYCRKAQRPRRALWKSGWFRSLYGHASRRLVDLRRVLHRV